MRVDEGHRIFGTEGSSHSLLCAEGSVLPVIDFRARAGEGPSLLSLLLADVVYV